MLRRTLGLGAVLALALALSGCPAGARQEGGAPQATKVALKDFTIEPDSFTINRGKATFAVANQGASVHNFTVDGVPGARSQDLAPGATQNLEVMLDKAGTYQVVCTVPGHSESGMVGTLTVK